MYAYYSKASNSYHTITPSSFMNNSAYYDIVNTSDSGTGLTTTYVSSPYAVRPVITLMPDVQYSTGDGTYDNPYYFYIPIEESS